MQSGKIRNSLYKKKHFTVCHVPQSLTVVILIKIRSRISERGSYLKPDVKKFESAFHANEELAEMNSDRKNRHFSFTKRNRESRSLIFNNPAVPIIYPASGLHVQPHSSIFIPLTITEVNYNLE